MRSLLLAAALVPIDRAAAREAPPHQQAKAVFESGRPVAAAFRGELRAGTLHCSDGRSRAAMLAGPDIKSLPVELASGRVVIIASGDGAELRQVQDDVVLERISPDRSVSCYGVFPRPSAPAAAPLFNPESTNVAVRGVRVEGHMALDLQTGSMPLGTLATSGPYQGPRLGGGVKRLQRYGKDSFLAGLDLAAEGSYTGSFDGGSAALIDLKATANAWLNPRWNVELGHQRRANSGMPDSTPTYQDQGNPQLRATWLGLHYVPTGMDSKQDRLEYYLDIYRIPGHCGGSYEDQCFVGGERNNSFPARVRGENVPVKGWELGTRVSHLIAESVRLPFGLTIRDLALKTHVAAVGGTPFDNPESLHYGASLSAYVAKNWIAGLRGNGIHNINKSVVRDENSDRPDSSVSQYGLFVLREFKD